jgi:transcriptional regulator with XRE-family HTH domain
MSSKLARPEAKTFSERFRKALAAAGVPQSPTVIAHEFNLRYWGKSVSLYAVRNWLLGQSMPTQDKLRALAQWLDVSPHELRFGPEAGGLTLVREIDPSEAAMGAADRAMLARYLQLDARQRKLVCDLIAEFKD